MMDKILLSLNFSNPQSAIANVIILIFIAAGIYSGYKKGFLESSIRFLGTIAAIIGAYLFKNPISIFLYTHLPFFKFDGLFKGISILNVIVYEIIAFIILFVLLMIIINLICKLTGLVEKLLSFILLFGLPNKILGAIVGFIESIIILYFVAFIFKFSCNFFGYTLTPSLIDDIIEVPVLKNTFGDTLNSLDEIVILAKDYEDTQDKEEFNNQATQILLKYNIITKENLQILIDNGKINVDIKEIDNNA